MSAAPATLTPQEPGKRHISLSFERFFLRCDSDACPHRGKIWPPWRRKPDTMEFQGQQYCSVACAQVVFELETSRLLQMAQQSKQKPHRIPLGLLLLSRGVINNSQLKEALRAQRENGRGRLGQWLQELGAMTENDLVAALGVQWGCPVFPLKQHEAYLQCANMLPLWLLEFAHILPVHFVSESRTLYLVFTERIDRTLVRAIEQMLDCHAAPCVASESAVSQAFERIRGFYRPQETVFDTLRQPGEIAAAVGECAIKLRALHTQVTRAADHIWFRLQNATETHDLLFLLPS